jgi:hypothetical protein
MIKLKPWHRRHALSLAAQLPEDLKDRRAVLAGTNELSEKFLDRRRARRRRTQAKKHKRTG